MSASLLQMVVFLWTTVYPYSMWIWSPGGVARIVWGSFAMTVLKMKFASANMRCARGCTWMWVMRPA
eukprot:1365759-Rhodomonas_salina.1